MAAHVFGCATRARLIYILAGLITVTCVMAWNSCGMVTTTITTSRSFPTLLRGASLVQAGRRWQHHDVLVVGFAFGKVMRAVLGQMGGCSTTESGMAWERRRNGRLYYYRSYRDHSTGRVHKQYLGSGLSAEEAARQDASKREERLRRRAEEQARRDEHQAMESLVGDVNHEATAILEATLLAANYYRHHREWRRRRATAEEKD